MTPTGSQAAGAVAINVPDGVLWGPQTARSLQLFSIGSQRMPVEVIEAMGWVKWAAANVNRGLDLLPEKKAQAIAKAARAVAQGLHADAFPLSVWQTGSGTQSHMNVNEVIARLARQSLRNDGHASETVHPNDDVNLGQSSNDVFPTAMHIAVAKLATKQLLPALRRLSADITAKSHEFEHIVKVGRTHLQDATPITFGQELSGYAAQLALCETALMQALVEVHALAIGGTAVGTGLNTHPEFGMRVVALLAYQLDLPLRQADNLYAALAGHEALVAFHAALRMLAIVLIKIAADIRLMGCGPRAGLGELHLPENEAGSSIMPGKVNPTQAEALIMVCTQVMGHDVAIGIAASQGQLELNVFKPLIVLNVLDSVQLLSGAMNSFAQHCVAGMQVNRPRVEAMVRSSLMLVTALVPHIGYDRAGDIARHAQAHDTTLREAALASGSVSAVDFDLWVDPQRMLGPAST